MPGVPCDPEDLVRRVPSGGEVPGCERDLAPRRGEAEPSRVQVRLGERLLHHRPGDLGLALPAFDAVRVLDEIERHGVTHMAAVPTMLAALNEEQSARPRAVSSLRGILHGGAPIATETLRRAHVAFPAAELPHIYGTTETADVLVDGWYRSGDLGDQDARGRRRRRGGRQGAADPAS